MAIQWCRQPAFCASVLCAAVYLAPKAVRAQFLNVAIETRAPTREDAVTVDEVVATIEVEGDDRPPVFVLESEVELSLRFELMAGERATSLARRGMLEQVIGERLLEREAQRAGDAAPSATEIEEERLEVSSRLASTGGPMELVRSLGLSDGDVEAFVRSRLVVARFLERHIARSIEPLESELRAAYETEQFGAYRAEGVPFGVARHDIRDHLVRLGYPRAIRAYLRSLGGRAQIRLWRLGGSQP